MARAIPTLVKLPKTLNGIDNRIKYAQWEEENEFWELSEPLSLNHSLGPKMALIYQAGIFGVRYPEVIATDYLYLELIPKIVYLRDTDFDAEYFFTARTEIICKG